MGVPKQWNRSDDLKRGRPGSGVHPDVRHMIAPAGSAIIYDSRTWHRRCPECNSSGGDRIAILNAVIRRHHAPMHDKTHDVALYENSNIPSMLTESENQRVRR